MGGAILGWLGKRVGSYFSRKFLSPAIATFLVVWAVKSMTGAEVGFKVQLAVIVGCYGSTIAFTIMEGLLEKAGKGKT